MSSVSVFRAKLLSPEIMDEVISAGKKSSRDVLNTQDRGGHCKWGGRRGRGGPCRPWLSMCAAAGAKQ